MPTRPPDNDEVTMSVRRGTARLVTVCVSLAGLMLVGAAPAVAEGDSVRLRVSSGFTAGGSAGSATTSVTKRTKRCVAVRAALGIRLAGLNAGQLRVEQAVAGSWRPVPLSDAGSGQVVTTRTAMERPVLCEKQSTASRYRVTFLAGAPAGRATVSTSVYTGTGVLVGRAMETVRITARRGATPSASPTPEAVPAEPAEPAGSSEPATQVEPAAAAASSDSGGFGLGSAVMLFGGTMILIGAALLVMLVRRNRADQAGDEPTPAVAGGPHGVGGYQPATGYPGAQSAYPGAAQPYPGGQRPGTGTAYRSTFTYPSGGGQPTIPYQASPAWSAGAGPATTGQPGPGGSTGQPGPGGSTGQPGSDRPAAPAGGTGDATAIMPRMPD